MFAPDYAKGIALTSTTGATFTAPDNGFIVVFSTLENAGDRVYQAVWLSINNIICYKAEKNNNTTGITVSDILPICKNDILKFTEVASVSCVTTFYPARSIQ